MFRRSLNRGKAYRESLSRPANDNEKAKTENGNGNAHYEMIELAKKPTTSKSLTSAIQEGLADLVQELLTQEVHKRAVNVLDGTGLAFLHHAARYGRVEVAKLLFENGADLNVRSSEGMTPLLVSIRYDRLAMFKVLLSLDADPTIADNHDNTVLHHAVNRGNATITEILIHHLKIEVDTTNNAQMTSLHLACNLGNEQLSELLISRGADIRAKSSDHVTPLHLAVASMNLKVVKLLVRKAEDQKISTASLLNEPDFDGNSPLHLAAHTSDQNIAVTCLTNGAKVNARNNKQECALHIAAAKGSLDVVSLLVACGADVNMMDSGMRTALHITAALNHDRVVRFLARSGAHMDTADSNNCTPFLSAVAAGKTEAAKELIKFGANVQASDTHKKNCAHICIENGRLDVLCMLLEMPQSCACLNIPDIEGRYPIHYAAVANDFKILEAILSTGDASAETLSIQDGSHQTPLHLAAASGLVEHVQALVRHAAAGLDKTDDQGRTPLHNAAAGGMRKVCAILIQAGADVNHKENNRWTPLMLAAQKGCHKTCETLLNNQAYIYDTTIYGETALSIAMATGHPECVKLFLDRRANFSECSSEDETGFNIGSSSVAMAIVTHERWQEILGSRHNYMEYLIQHYPDAAKVVLDKCIYRSGLSSDPDYTVTYDFRFLNPGPDSTAQDTTGKPFFAPSVMVEHEREELLLHPLTKKLIDIKWICGGRYLYYFFFIWYLLFLVVYSIYVINEREKVKFGPPPGRGNFTKKKLHEIFGDKPQGPARVFQWIVLVFVFFHMLKELVQMFVQKFRYFTDISNLTEWVLYITTLFFILPYLIPAKTLHKMDANSLLRPQVLWVSGVISIFLAYVNLILFFRRFRVFGLYVSMFLEVTKTVVHVLVAFFVFILAFAIVFFVLFKEQSAFETVGRSIMRTSIMMIGEFDYEANFISTIGATSDNGREQLNPIKDAAFAFLALFMILMSIVLMNLMVGLAVGDIETIRRNATLKRLSQMVDYVADVDKKYPRFILRWLYKPRHVERPYKTIQRHFKKNASQKIRALDSTLEPMDTLTSDTGLNDVTRHVMKNRQRIKTMMTMLEAQNRLLRNLARTLGREDIDVDLDREGHVTDETAVAMTMEKQRW